jgi:hypothetical protein
MGAGFLYIVVLAAGLFLVTFYYDKDIITNFADNELAIMNINGDIVLGETNSDSEINVLLRDVVDYKQGEYMSYVKSETEFAIINEKAATRIIKSISKATKEEQKALEEVLVIEKLY